MITIFKKALNSLILTLSSTMLMPWQPSTPALVSVLISGITLPAVVTSMMLLAMPTNSLPQLNLANHLPMVFHARVLPTPPPTTSTLSTQTTTRRPTPGTMLTSLMILHGNNLKLASLKLNLLRLPRICSISALLDTTVSRRGILTPELPTRGSLSSRERSRPRDSTASMMTVNPGSTLTHSATDTRLAVAITLLVLLPASAHLHRSPTPRTFRATTLRSSKKLVRPVDLQRASLLTTLVPST